MMIRQQIQALDVRQAGDKGRGLAQVFFVIRDAGNDWHAHDDPSATARKGFQVVQNQPVWHAGVQAVAGIVHQF